MKKNCWEIKNCGREPGGINAEELGVCPAAISEDFDGTNNGKNAGRFCWAVAGTLCDSCVSGTYAMKLASCINCEFLKIVNKEEGREFILTPKMAKNKKEGKNPI